MAVMQLVATVGANDQYGIPLSVSVKGVGDPIAGFPSDTAVDDAVATLVADGAAPTEQHVTDLDAAWTTYQASVTTFTTGILTGNVTVGIDKASITTRRQLKAALDAIYKAAEGGFASLTP